MELVICICIFILIYIIWLLLEKLGTLKVVAIIIIAFFIFVGYNYIIDTLKTPTEKLNLKTSTRVEDFAEQELPSFIKNRDDIANTILKMEQKKNKHLEDINSIKSENAKNKLLKEVENLDINISVIRKKAEDINISIEELYAIKETENKDVFKTKIHAILKKSEDLKAEASAMASDMEKTF